MGQIKNDGYSSSRIFILFCTQNWPHQNVFVSPISFQNRDCQTTNLTITGQ
jgi:hypothetical protein